MALSFEQVGANKSKEIRFKAPAALVEEFENGRKELKARGIEANINEELVKVVTKINAEIQAYLANNPIQVKGAESPEAAPGGEAKDLATAS
ncbi:hypothetical protein GPK29_22445 [Aeromonas hydrophila]|uniref:hypothetical protein n=1 Tax=Aeromonas hydrophila TaxID=644 RepID=UPI001C5B0402|nr:hypothetical protein [Aeromonas hydrophila]MBW3798956.1 hypothetical protein [Aeromonas hydrophila]MBW3803749.1 hypothetical protein [Aeromonas hydrophila]MBW3821938.1 hypothetical protein [Aeromonas hydrophila]